MLTDIDWQAGFHTQCGAVLIYNPETVAALLLRILEHAARSQLGGYSVKKTVQRARRASQKGKAQAKRKKPAPGKRKRRR